MKTATLLSIAFVLTFIVEHATTKYLLIEIDDEIDGGLGSIGGMEEWAVQNLDVRPTMARSGGGGFHPTRYGKRR